MYILLIGAVLITLPAIIVLVYALVTGSTLMAAAALASFGLNSLPFVAGWLMTRRQAADGDALGH